MKRKLNFRRNNSVPDARGRDFKAAPNALLLALAVALTLAGLRSLAGSFDHLIFWRLTFVQDIGAAWLSVTLILLAWLLARFWAPSIALGSLFERVADWVDRNILWVSLATFPLYGALAFFVAHGRALAADEYSVLFQSEAFASGNLTARVQPELINWIVPAFSQGHFFHISHEQGMLVSGFWPGYALLLSPFTFLGVPYLCNPFLTSLTLWAIHRVARRITNSSLVALWATLFTAVSPVIALNAASYFSMPAHLLFNALFCLLLLRQTRRTALMAGILGGLTLLLHNPVPHAAFALPWMLWMLWRRRDLFWRALFGYLFIGFPLLLMWSLYANAFDASRYALAYEAHGASAGPLVDILSRLRVVFAPPILEIWIARLTGMCKMVVWAVPALPILAWGGAQTISKNRWLRLSIISFWTTFTIYLFVRFDQGAGWGFRYLHSVWLVLPLLAGVFLVQAPHVSGGVSIRRFAAFCALLSGLILTPFQAVQVNRFLEREYGQIPDVSAPASLTFINAQAVDYSDSLLRNDAFLRTSDWKLLHRSDAADARLAKRVLVGARLEKHGAWGQIWVGDAIRANFRRS
ncbi:hypothetical protein [Abditibacterium utsteinense]|uniref:hypothetical protein n=1 Tax=Abditibacterium utsteinense TaxID=1960156 RepID=UPI000F46C607|nr:hypothetical protein [Abditibacterium utsteinense]